MLRKNIIITGVAGLLGSQMARWILENKKDYNVIGIDNLFGGYIEYIPKEVDFYKRELSKDNLSDIFEKGIDYVFHFAAYAAEGLSPFMRKFNYENNMLSTANIINNCITYNVKRLVYTSSMSVYGWGKERGKYFDENDRPRPIDPYAISKYACEMDIKVAGEQHGLDWCIIRPHNVYGINQNIWDKYRNVLGIWMRQALNGEQTTIYGDGEQTRAFSYIDDSLPCLWEAAVSEKTNHEIINLGGIRGYTINESAKIFKEVTGYNNFVYMEPRHEVKYCVPTHQKSMDLLGYKDKTSLKEGLTKMWEWAKVQPNRPQYKWENYEITKGIYSYWV